MTDFSGKMKANKNPEFHQQPAPPVPPDCEDPSKRTMLFLTIDARTKGECNEDSPGSTKFGSLSRQRLSLEARVAAETRLSAQCS